MSNTIEDAFAITDAYSLNYGATVIDESPHSGYNPYDMTKVKNLVSMKPKEALNFYPEIIDLQNELSEDTLSLATTWINGFTPVTGGLPTPFATNRSQLHRRIASRMHNRGVATSEQLISVRNDAVMNTLFANFCWYNGGRIVDANKVDDSMLDSVVLKSGSVSKSWGSQPPQIRFMVRQTAFFDENNEAVPDYLYLIGGSMSITNPQKAIETIQKFSGMKMSEVDDNYWCANPDINTEGMIQVARICFGIIMIRNYLMYAKHYIGVENIVDIDFKRDSRFINRPIDEVIDEYEPAFIYCRNLSNIFGI